VFEGSPFDSGVRAVDAASVVRRRLTALTSWSSMAVDILHGVLTSRCSKNVGRKINSGM